MITKGEQMLGDGAVSPGSPPLASSVMAPRPFCRQQNENRVFVSFKRRGRLITTKWDCPVWEGNCISLICSPLFLLHTSKDTHTHTDSSGNPLLWFVDIIYWQYLSPTWPGAFSTISTGSVTLRHYQYSSAYFPFGRHPLAKFMCVFISSVHKSFIFKRSMSSNILLVWYLSVLIFLA